jgi:hypothetical protein
MEKQIVNYTYYLSDDKVLPEFLNILFKYSVEVSKKNNFTVNIHCNENFKKLCEEYKIVPDNFIPLEEDETINSKVFWAYQKIKVYNKQPIGEWHLDTDAVFKVAPTLDKNYDLQVAYLDASQDELEYIDFPENYVFPEFYKKDLLGYNMSAVCFHSQELKDLYCKNAFEFMQNNKVSYDAKGWEHMVFIEQASLKQICEYYNYSYKFLVEDLFNSPDYYHMASDKSRIVLSSQEIFIKELKDELQKLQTD